jgi:hypothetical protein
VGDEKNTNGLKKLGVHLQRMIVNSSMVNVNLPVTDPIPSLVAFLDLKTSGQARNHLKYELQNNSGLNFEPSQFATALHSGQMLWDRRDCPSIFFVFLCGWSSAFTVTSQESFVLHMLAVDYRER